MDPTGGTAAANDDSILLEATFPLPQIAVLLSHDFKSEQYVQTFQDFIEVVKVSHLHLLLPSSQPCLSL
jgi:hypothetical protein